SRSTMTRWPRADQPRRARRDDRPTARRSDLDGGRGFRGGRRSPFGDRPIAVAPIARAPGGRVAESLERPAVPACPGAVLVWWGRAMVAPEVADERERRTDYVRGRRRVGQDDPDDAARAMASSAGAEGGAHARAGRDSARRRGA